MGRQACHCPALHDLDFGGFDDPIAQMRNLRGVVLWGKRCRSIAVCNGKAYSLYPNSTSVGYSLVRTLPRYFNTSRIRFLASMLL